MKIEIGSVVISEIDNGRELGEVLELADRVGLNPTYANGKVTIQNTNEDTFKFLKDITGPRAFAHKPV